MSAAIDQDTIALVNRHPAMKELAVFAYSVNRAIGFTETVDHEFPRPFAVFPILKEAVVVATLPVPGPPDGTGHAFIVALKELQLRHG
jgi:hypothetical protein